MPLIKTKGINLKSFKIGEADKIIRIFSRDHGKISLIAKGARKPKSKFGGRLEPLAYNEYLLATGKSLYVLSQVGTIESFYKLREDEEQLKAAAFAVKLIDSSTDDGQKNPELFDLLLNSLQMIGEGIQVDVFKLFFQLRLMEIEGFFPYLDGCVKCKKMVTVEPKSVNFNQHLGGLTCSACSSVMAWGTKVEYQLVSLMKKLRSCTFAELKDMPLKADEIESISSIVAPYISDHIGKDIRNW
jgi:DNA repair protein RecO (recombination protein O)